MLLHEAEEQLLRLDAPQQLGRRRLSACVGASAEDPHLVNVAGATSGWRNHHMHVQKTARLWRMHLTFLLALVIHMLATSLSMAAVTCGAPMDIQVRPKVATVTISGSMNLSGTHASILSSWK